MAYEIDEDKLKAVQEGFIQFGEGSWRRKRKEKKKKKKEEGKSIIDE